MKKSLVLSKQRESNGFTLIEILVVATIIGLLAAGAAVTYSQFAKQSRDARRKADLEQVRAALEMCRSNDSINCYPVGSWSALSILTGSPKYIQSLPTDPKSSVYSYYYSGTASDYTLGAYLEAGGTTCAAGQCGGNCNYCVGPYGQK